MARPKNQSARRRLIRQAANRAIAERGLAGVRVKDVAREAGLSSQAILYYYPDIEALLVEALRHTIERFADRRRAAAEAIDDPIAQLVATIREGFPEGPDDDELLVLYQSLGALRENPALQPLSKALTGSQVELYRRILEVGQARGVFQLADDSRTIAWNLVALEDAYGLYIMVDREPSVEEAIRRVLSYARIATGADLPADGPS